MSSRDMDVPRDPSANPPPPGLRPRELARWTWRQLTSMRTALMLLFLLALAAVPGSVIPQQAVDSGRVSRWQTQHPRLTPVYDKLDLFNVYASPWFAAIYLLLMISLIGCVLPRLRVYWRAWRAAPPPTPRNLVALPEHRTWRTTASPAEVTGAAHALLAKRRFRLRPSTDAATVSAQRGYLREAGNLLFHSSLLVVLVGYGIGSMFGFQGTVIVVTGNGFSNSVSQYDEFRPGAAYDLGKLAPFSFTLKRFHVTFIREGRGAGAPSNFYADLNVRTPGAREQQERISVNHPLTMNGTKVFILGHGYAPHITIRDGQGRVAYSGTTVFLPERQDLTSFGVVKAPDARPTQLALEGEFYPTYAFTMRSGPFTAFPDAKNPAVSMLAYQGDLRMDSGLPQSIYTVDKAKLRPVRGSDGKPIRVDLALGATQKLPNGLGTVTFDGLQRFVRFQASQSPGTSITLGGTILALVGLLGSLFIRPRRVWLRTHLDGAETVIELAGLDRSSGGNLAAELDALQETLSNKRRP